MKTVNLVHTAGCKRAKTFKQALSQSTEYKEDVSKPAVEVNKNVDYNVFFNFSGFESAPSEMVDAFSILEEHSYYVLDISDKDFTGSSFLELYVILIAYASYVTCSDEHLQEAIFHETGRIAYIVPDEVTKEDLEPPTTSTDPSILWFGDTKDVMTVRPYITNNVHDIAVACTSEISNTSDRAKTVLIHTDKNKQQVLKSADVVFLPKTYTAPSEMRRYYKVEEALKHGKFVIAKDLEPFDWDGLAFNGTLEEGLDWYLNNSKRVTRLVKSKQKHLLHSTRSAVRSLEKALELTETDTYLLDLANTL